MSINTTATDKLTATVLAKNNAAELANALAPAVRQWIIVNIGLTVDVSVRGATDWLRLREAIKDRVRVRGGWYDLYLVNDKILLKTFEQAEYNGVTSNAECQLQIGTVADGVIAGVVNNEAVTKWTVEGVIEARKRLIQAQEAMQAALAEVDEFGNLHV